MQKRLDWIDAVKGTCLLLVMIAHLWQPCPHWVHVLTGGYMQVFFVMAGVTSLASSRSLREQLMQKSKRLLVPYAFYGIILLLAGVILPTQAEFGKGLLGLLYGRYSLYPLSVDSNIPLLQACGYLAPFWFLPCIFLSYVLMAWYDHSRYPYLLIVLAVIVGIVTPLLPVLLPWCIEMSFVGFLLMLCGRALRHVILEDSAKPKSSLWLLLMIWIGCAVVYAGAWWLNGPVNMSLNLMGNTAVFFPFRVVFFCLLGVSEAVFFSLSFRAIQPVVVTRCFAYVGRQALRLMCIHLFIGQGVYYLLADKELPMALTFACAIGVVFLINFLLDYSIQWISSKKAAGDIPAEKH